MKGLCVNRVHRKGRTARPREKTMNVGDIVETNLFFGAKVIGRTYEADPKIDLRTPWGVLSGIPLSVLVPGAQKERLPKRITKMGPRHRNDNAQDQHALAG